jgi:KDO2-lipid IV(A) lauroyltransferase
LDNPHLNAYIMGVRDQTGQSILYKSGAVAGMSEVLEEKGSLAFVADQDAGPRGVFVNFFGRPASTFRSIALMAMRHEVPIIVGYGRRLGTDYQFEVGIQRVIHPSEWANQADPLTWTTQEFTRELETLVRRCPEQYLWAHRRWKHRPDGTKAAGDGVA